MRTRNLMAKVLCYQRQACWGFNEGFGPLISPVELKTLQSTLQHRPPLELQQAAAQLGVCLEQVGLHEC
jgi:hypothetical protein